MIPICFLISIFGWAEFFPDRPLQNQQDENTIQNFPALQYNAFPHCLFIQFSDTWIF